VSGLIERYREQLPFAVGDPVVSLGEGSTPLVEAPALSERVGAQVWLKLEGANPTGSFKDRGMTCAVSAAVREGAGVAELFVGATTAWGPGLVKLIPPAVHGMIDYVFTAALVVAPFVFGFDDDTTALVFFLVVGIGGLALVAATRFVEEPTAAR
jgi:hypothetical protein